MEEHWEEVERLVKRLLELDNERLAVVITCDGDLKKGVTLTMPIMREHKAVLAALRQLMEA